VSVDFGNISGKWNSKGEKSVYPYYTDLSNPTN